MFGIGMPEMLVILALALIIIGPKKLPDLAKTLGRTMREFKKATSEFKETIQLESELSEAKETFNDISGEVKDAVDLNLKSDERKADKIESDDEKNEGKDKEHESGSNDAGNLETPKEALDDPEDQRIISQKEDATKQNPSPDSEDNHNKTKGPVDDA